MRHSISRLVRPLAAAALVAAAAGCGGAGDGGQDPEPSVEPAQDAEYRDDFNKDGYADLAVLVPETSVDRQKGAGAVAVIYGSENGPDPATRQMISQNSADVPGAADPRDGFGGEAVTGDFDGDGYADLAVLSDGENVEPPEDAPVMVLWGSDTGLGGATALDASLGGDRALVDLVGGDFNADGARDLIAYRGSGDAVSLKGPFTREGGVASQEPVGMGSLDLQELVTGDINGDGGTDLVVMTSFEEMGDPTEVLLSSPSGLKDAESQIPAFSGAIGDFDKDGYGDLVMRVVPGGIVEDSYTDPGTIMVLYGSADGLKSGPGTKFTQDSAGIPGESEEGAKFGFKLDAGDVDGDGYADVVASTDIDVKLGAPGDSPGSVVLLKGGPDGLSGSGARMFDQDTESVPGSEEAGDGFGWALRLGDFNGDDRADLAVGGPGENDYQGAFWTLRITGKGLVDTGSYGPEKFGILDPKAHFGEAFAK